MITGIIDIGTNTFNLLIEDEKGQVFYNDKIPVKLGKGGIDKNIIAPDAFERGLVALASFKEICVEKEAHQIFAFATSAVRSATNGPEFVRQADEKAGIKINVIDGDREALFIFEGVRKAINLGNTPAMIVDIGGGSTEIVIANQNQVLWEKSYPLGVSRLLEMFKPTDPITAEEISTIENHLDIILVDLWPQVAKYQPDRIIGSSGSFETLHDVCAARFEHPLLLPEQTNSRISLNEFAICSAQLLKSSIAQRLEIPGMLPMRADTLHLSALQINFLLKKSNIKTLLISMYALKEGVLFSINKEHEPWQTSLL